MKNNNLKYAFIIICILSNVTFLSHAQKPQLGVYPNVSVLMGSNSTVIPSQAPLYTQRAVAYTSADFSGTLLVNPTTGVVSVTNAKVTGKFKVTVKCFNNLGNATTSFILMVTNPQCSDRMVSKTANIAVGLGPHMISIGDFNGDGHQDFATPNYFSNSVSVRLGDGEGGFGAGEEIAVAYNPNSLSTGDYNSDGKLDIAALCFGSELVVICINDGTGHFTDTNNVNVGYRPLSLVSADINLDGKIDIVTTNTLGSISIRLGDGRGNYIHQSSSFVPGNEPANIAVADFNNDKKPDLAVVNKTDKTVSIGLGDGTGGFTIASTILIGGTPYGITIGDFNGDGKQDFATPCKGNRNDSYISIRIGDGLGNFNSLPNIGTVNYARSIDAGDFNGDGKLDLAVVDYYSGTVSTKIGNGLGGFNNGTITEVAKYSTFITLGDFDQDGRQDFAVIGGGVAIRLGRSISFLIRGNDRIIANGDTIPGSLDNTSFGKVCAFSSPISHSFSIKNTGALSIPLSTLQLKISGLDSALFFVNGISLSDTIFPETEKNFLISFSPRDLIGIRSAEVHFSYQGICNYIDYHFKLNAMVKALPKVSSITGTHSFCVGTSSDLNIANTGGVWTSSDTFIAKVNKFSGLVIGKNAGAAIIKFTTDSNSNGCFNYSTDTVNILPKPYIEPIVGNTTVCVGKSVKLTNSTQGGIWKSSNKGIATITSNSGIVTGIATGSLIISYVVNQVCTSNVSLNMIVTPPCFQNTATISGRDGSHNSNSSAFSVRAFPNPSSNTFNIKVDSKSEKIISLRILDVQGISIFEKTIYSNKIFHVSQQLAAGIYWLEIKQGETMRITKFIKIN